ncbi:hypothetical protein C3E89_06075 [Clostridium sp. Cult1]|nr:hypothetical protein [Clostridium sp. Cult1]
MIFQRFYLKDNMKQHENFQWVFRDKLILDKYVYLPRLPSVGKTHLVIALGYKAINMGYKVSFISMVI